MAFRFRREGQFVKNRLHLDQSGFRPFMDELKWEVLEWHYNFYMAPQILKTLLKHQRGNCLVVESLRCPLIFAMGI